MVLEAGKLELAGVGSLAIATLSGSWTPSSSCWRRGLHGGDAAEAFDRRDGALLARSLSSRGDEGNVVAELSGWAWSGVELVECLVEYSRLWPVSAGEAVVDLDDFAGSLADVGEVDHDAGVLLHVFVHALTRDFASVHARHAGRSVAPSDGGRPWWWP